MLATIYITFVYVESHVRDESVISPILLRFQLHNTSFDVTLKPSSGFDTKNLDTTRFTTEAIIMQFERLLSLSIHARIHNTYA